jgi:uncharacterized repeat protein (TIGR01451 family)
VKPIHLCAIVTVVGVATVHASHPLSPADGGEKLRIVEAYGRLPLAFEANRGQTDADVQFVARGAGYTLFLTSTEAVLALRKAPHELRMKLVDSNAVPRVSQDDELAGKSHYIIGSDRRNWHTDVPRYGKVRYQDVYPGVDLVYYGNQQQLEYDFIVAPGADPTVIELGFEGAERISVDVGGDLLLETGDNEVRLKAPIIYQDTEGRRVEIPGGYRKTGSNRVAFELGSYDSTRPLVIDPVLLYSSYLGGSSSDYALGIAIDPDGGAYVTGFATSVDFPTAGALQPACAPPGCEDAFITKIGQGGYSTYLGGTGGDVATGIAVRSDTREAYITGWTRSRDFPTVNAVDPVFVSEDHFADQRAFVAKLNASGSELLYSTYLGGDEPIIHANAVAVDSDGAAYVTGSAGYNEFGQAFVTKLVPDGSALAYSARLDGPAIGYGIAVDAQGYALVTGAAGPGFSRVNSSQPTSGHGFAARLVPDGSTFVYARYLDGDGIGTGIAVAGPDAYVTGVMPGPASCCDWFSPAGPGGGPTDAFVQILDFPGHGGNATHLGGTGEDRGSAIGVDFAGNVWVTGITTSTDFPLINPLQGQVHDLDAFVVRFNSRLEPVFATYLGGSGHEQLLTDVGNMPWPPGPALGVDRFGLSFQFGPGYPGHPPGLAYIAGFTDSTDFPTAGLSPALQPTTNGPVNSFLTLIVDDGIPTKPDLVVTEIGRSLGGVPVEAELGASLYYVFQVTNKGPARARDVTFFDKLPPGVIVDGVYPEPSYLYPRTCPHDDRWVFCDLGPLSEGESVIIPIFVRPTTVGAQIDTAAVIDASSWACPTCISTAFFRWIYGFDQDLVWGPDAGLDADIHDNTVTTTTVITPGSVDLSVAGSASPDIVMLDGTLTYTLDVANLGAATTAATLTDTLPAGTTLVSATQLGSYGTCIGTSVITCQWPSLTNAQVTIVVRATASGTLTNTAVVSGPSTDPDSANNAVTFTTRVNRPPTANAGPDQTASAGASCRAIVTLNGTASTDLDGDALTYTWTADNLLPPPILLAPADPSSGTVTGPTPAGPLPLGTHTITLTVNDGHGGTASDTVVVTVRDVTAPTFSGVPAPITLEQSSPSGTTFSVAMAAAADNCSGSVAVSSNAPAIFPPGPTVVTFTARDAASNSASAATTVTVVDTTPPTFSNVPAPIIVQQSMPSGASALVPMPTATDSVSGSVAVSSNAPAVFPPGPTTVMFTARDAAGNSATATTTVTVVDTTPPTVAIVSPQARDYVHSDVLTFSFSATDAASGLAVGMPTASLDGTAVTSGQGISLLTLGLGMHSFVLVATDAAGNSVSPGVTIRVIATLDSLIASVSVFAGQQKIDDSNTVKGLLAKLNDAKQAAQRGNKAAAINKLQEFIDLALAQSAKHIAPEAAQTLVTDAQYVIGALR